MEQVLYKLPNGWEWQTIEEVAQIGADRGFSPTPDSEGNVPFIGMTDIDQETGQKSTYELRNFDDVKKGYTKFQRNAVLFAKITPCTENNKTALIGNVDGGFATTEVFPIHALDSVEPKYLLHFFRSPSVRRFLIDQMEGATGRQRVPLKALKGVSVPVCGLDEQKLIIEKLDALLTRIDTAIEHLQESVTLADALYASALDKQFSKLMKESDIFPFKKLVDNQDGRRIPIKAGERKNTHGTYPYYGATGVIDYVDDFIFEGERLLISEDGANLVARKYPIAFIADGKYWVNNHAHVVNALPELTSNLYLKKFFAWVDLSSYITGSAQPKLSQGKLNTIPVPVPPLSEQTEIVAELDKAYQLTETLKKEIGEKLGILTSLKASILDSAFKGEL